MHAGVDPEWQSNLTGFGQLRIKKRGQPLRASPPPTFYTQLRRILVESPWFWKFYDLCQSLILLFISKTPKHQPQEVFSSFTSGADAILIHSKKSDHGEIEAFMRSWRNQVFNSRTQEKVEPSCVQIYAHRHMQRICFFFFCPFVFFVFWGEGWGHCSSIFPDKAQNNLLILFRVPLLSCRPSITPPRQLCSVKWAFPWSSGRTTTCGRASQPCSKSAVRSSESSPWLTSSRRYGTVFVCMTNWVPLNSNKQHQVKILRFRRISNQACHLTHQRYNWWFPEDFNLTVILIYPLSGTHLYFLFQN